MSGKLVKNHLFNKWSLNNWIFTVTRMSLLPFLRSYTKRIKMNHRLNVKTEILKSVKKVEEKIYVTLH